MDFLHVLHFCKGKQRFPWPLGDNADALPSQPLPMSAPPPGHVFLVDDNPDIRHNLSLLLRKMGYAVDTYADAAEFVRMAPRMSPAVLVLDVRMPQMTGVELQAHLAALGWRTPIVFISGESEHQEIIQAMKGGAVDFLWKPFPIQSLVDAIERGLAQDAERQTWVLRHQALERKFRDLSMREREVLTLMLQGLGNKAMGERLQIQPDTIKKHRAQILQKMQALDLPELIAMCQGMAVDEMLAALNNA